MNNRSVLLLAVTLGIALLYCLALLFLREKGAMLVLSSMAGMVALYYSFRNSRIVLGLLIAAIGLGPFFLSLRIFPGLPKLYVEDVFFVYYAAYFFVFYGLLGKKRFHLGSATIVVVFFLFVIAACVPFVTEPVAKSAMRNFSETFLLGFFFYMVFNNETESSNIDTLIAYIAVTTLCLSFAVCIEVVAQSNPLMEAAERLVEDFVYLAPSYYEFLGDYYRPYVVFFHPSELGTFVAMGVPFVYYAVRDRHPLLKYGALALACAGVILNFTRGVWVALVFALLLCNFSRIKRFIPFTAAAGALALGLFFLTMGDSPFAKRMFDPSNFSNRLYYWKVGYNMFVSYFPFGIGHMNFKTRYLEFVDTEPAPPGLEVEQIFVADNVFLTTLVEHGFLGFLIQMLFYATVILILFRLRRLYRQRSDTVNEMRLNVILQAALIYLLAGTFADVQLFAKVTKMFFIILGMAMALSRFTETPWPAAGKNPDAPCINHTPHPLPGRF